MAFINLNLIDNSTYTINSSNYNDGDVVNINALGSSELIVDGVDVTINSIAGVEAAAAPTFTATGGGSLTISQGLLELGALNTINYNVQDSSAIDVNAGSISALGGVNNYNVNFSGQGDGSFTFTPPSGVSVLSAVTFNVDGMGAGDTLNLGGEDWEAGAYNSTTGVLTLEYDGTLLGLGLVGPKVTANVSMTQAQYDEFAADPDKFLSGGGFTQVCFAAGTMIATPNGEVAVEELSIGDIILTASGTQVPVKWIGRQTVGPLAAANNLPVCVRQDALAPGTPNQDLVLTAGHALIIDGLAINASALVNHSTIDYIPRRELPEAVTYYHIETENHEVIIANGTEAETYVDYITRQAFDNYDEYVELYGIETRIVEMPQPRISTRRHVPQVVRERLGIEDTTPVSRAA